MCAGRSCARTGLEPCDKPIAPGVRFASRDVGRCAPRAYVRRHLPTSGSHFAGFTRSAAVHGLGSLTVVCRTRALVSIGRVRAGLTERRQTTVERRLVLCPAPDSSLSTLALFANACRLATSSLRARKGARRLLRPVPIASDRDWNARTTLERCNQPISPQDDVLSAIHDDVLRRARLTSFVIRLLRARISQSRSPRLGGQWQRGAVERRADAEEC